MRIIFMGTPSFAVPILEALNDKYDVCLVVTQPDTYTGRKKLLTYSKVKEKALELGLEVFQPMHIKDDYELIIEKEADVIVTAAYGQIVPKIVLDSVKYLPINVHGSLLPKYRGGAPIQRAIMNGEEYLGVSIMKMIPKMDAGRVYAQGKIKLEDADTSKTMFEKLSILGRDLLLENIEDIVSGKNEGEKQDFTKVSFAYNISREEEFIDWHKSAKEIFNLVRALNDNPIASTMINGNVIKIYDVEETDIKSEKDPGTICSLNKSILVATSTNLIKIKSLKVAGKAQMNAKDFLNGQKILNVNDKFEKEINNE